MLVIVPNVELLRLAAGGVKFTRLNRLNASSRSCSSRLAAERDVLARREIELPEVRSAHVVARRVAERLALIGRQRRRTTG